MYQRRALDRSEKYRIQPSRLAMALCFALTLAACSPSTEDMMASARSYIAKNDVAAAGIQLKNVLQQDGTLAEARFLLGGVLLAEADYPGAVRELRRAHELGFDRSSVLPILARAMLLNGDHDRIIQDFATVQLDDPKLQALMLSRVGEAYLARGDGRDALGVFVTALGLDPDLLSAEVGLARSYLLLDDVDAAMSAADAVLAKSSDYADAFGVRAEVLRRRGDAEGFIREIKAALEVDPSAANYHFSLVGAFIELRRYDEALLALAEMRKVSPNTVGTHYLQAFVDLQFGRVTEARDSIEKALSLASSYLPANLLAGSIYLQLNDHLRVRLHMERVLGLEPNEPVARRVFATSLLATGNVVQAREVLSPLLDQPRVAVYDLALAGQIHLGLGDFNRATQYFLRVQEALPEDQASRTGLGLSRLALGDKAAGLADLETAAGLDPMGQADAMLVLANLREKRFAEAFEAQRQLAEKQPDSVMPMLLLGGIHLAMDDHAAARAAFDEALSRDGTNVSAVVNLVRLDLREGETDRARGRFEALIARSESSVEPYLMLAEFLRETNANKAEALAVLERGLKGNPQSRSVRMALARQVADMNDLPRAFTIAQELVAEQTTDAAALSLLAQIQAAMGDVQQAISSMNQVVNLQPHAPEPLLVISELQLSQRNTVDAENALRRAAALRPASETLNRRLINLLVDARRYRDAFDVARAVQRNAPEDPLGFILAAEVLELDGKRADAVRSYRDAIRFGAGPQVAARLHRLLLDSDQKTEASRLEAEWRAQHPADVVFSTYLAEIMLSAGKREQAEAEYRRLLAIEPKNPMLLNNLAWVAGQLGRDDALPLALSALEQMPDNPAVLHTVGTLLVRSGSASEAVSHLRRAVELAPNVLSFKLSLARAYLALGQSVEANRELDEVLSRAPEGSPLAVEAGSLRPRN